MAGKPKRMPFDFDRWFADRTVSACSPATRGVWIDWLGTMWEQGATGQIIGDLATLSVFGRCTPEQAESTIHELTATNTADITPSTNGQFTIINRKMRREYERKTGNRNRQQRYLNAVNDVAQDLDITQEADFERFWLAYPTGRKRGKNIARAAFAKALEKTDADTIVAAAAEYALSEVGMSKWVRMPSTWLNQEGWTDDRASWQDRDKPRSYTTISADQFIALHRAGKFIAGSPKRSETNQHHVYGTLRDGRQVECTDFPARQQKRGSDANG